VILEQLRPSDARQKSGHRSAWWNTRLTNWSSFVWYTPTNGLVLAAQQVAAAAAHSDRTAGSHDSRAHRPHGHAQQWLRRRSPTPVRLPHERMAIPPASAIPLV
jgi:hypothetical protein